MKAHFTMRILISTKQSHSQSRMYTATVDLQVLIWNQQGRAKEAKSEFCSPFKPMGRAMEDLKRCTIVLQEIEQAVIP